MADQGIPGERHLGYYRERAMGGAAMLVIEPVPVHAAAVLTRGNFWHSSDEVIPHFRKITDAVHEEGALILQQLYHVGQHGDADNSYHPNWSPSGLPSYHDSDGSHSMTEAEIEETIDGFVQEARRCWESRFDGYVSCGTGSYEDKLPTLTSPIRQRRDGLKIFGPAFPATRCAGEGVTVTTGSPAWSIHPPDVNLNGGETVLRKQHLPKKFLWSEEALQALKLAVWLRNRVTK